MNVMTKKNQDIIEGKKVPIKLGEPEKASDHLVPAPISPIILNIEKSATEVVLPITLYLEATFPPSSLSYCMETVLFEDSDNGKPKEKRIINIAYNHEVQENSFYKPHAYNLTLSNLDPNMEELEFTLFLTNMDPQTSRGTSTTVKREM